MEIRLYRLGKYKPRPNLPYLKNARNIVNRHIPTTCIRLQGNLRDAIDIKNPTIIIDISDSANIDTLGVADEDKESVISDFIDYNFQVVNYVFIPDFGRYYFIEKVTLLRKNLFSLSLHVDVLQHVDFIKSQQAFISRNQNDYNIELPDERRIVTNETTIEYITLTDTLSSDKYIKFDSSFLGEEGTLYDYPDVFNVFACCTSNTINTNWIKGRITRATAQPDGTDLPQVVSGLFVVKEFHGYLLNKNLTSELLGSAKGSSTVASAISTIYAYPFNFKNFPEYRDDWDNISLQVNFTVGDATIGGGTNPYKVHDKQMTSNYLLNASFIVPDTINDFNDLEPYSVYELYIPYYGYYKLPYNSIRGHEIYLYYVINFQCGEANVIIYDNTVDAIISSLKAQIGIEIPKTLSNALEVRNRRDANNTSLTIGLLASILGIAGSVITGGTSAVAGLGVASGLIAGGTTIANYTINEKNNISQYGTVNFNGDLAPIFSAQNVFIRKTKRAVQYSLTTAFLNNNGGVCNELKDLSSVTGYTEIASIPNIIYMNDDNLTDTESITEVTNEEIDEIIALMQKGVIIL